MGPRTGRVGSAAYLTPRPRHALPEPCEGGGGARAGDADIALGRIPQCETLGARMRAIRAAREARRRRRARHAETSAQASLPLERSGSPRWPLAGGASANGWAGEVLRNGGDAWGGRGKSGSEAWRGGGKMVRVLSGLLAGWPAGRLATFCLAGLLAGWLTG